MIKDPTPAEIEKHNNRKLTADKIRQILSKVLETPTQSAKRWVWELMQNAKDIPNQYGEVSIQIELTDNTLYFRHNGDPFSLNNVMGLIQQVSSKDSTNSDKEVTGKFGTGFISTHLLSRIIEVEGVLRHDGEYRNFCVKLDRRGDSSEELIPKINEALEFISDINNNTHFPLNSGYQEDRTENSFDTSFSYRLSSDNSKKWAQEGLADLINTLPQTLVNIPKIKTVEVINEGEVSSYTRRTIFTEGNVTGYCVDIVGEDAKNYLAFQEGNITLVTEVKSFDPIILTENFGKQPNLFRDFPLIGSEKFYFPFILNGHRFNPTEDRDSIVLHSEESKEANDNRLYIEEAIQSALHFSEWLISKNAHNRYICAFSKMPVLNPTWEEFSSSWFLELQKEWRGHLLSLELLETHNKRIIPIEEGLVPEFGKTNEEKERFYDLVLRLKGGMQLPKQSLLFDWLKVLGPKSDEKERENWGKKLTIDLYDIAEIIEDYESIPNLVDQTELDDQEEAFNWLGQLYQFITRTGESEIFDQHSLIPNENGVFKTLKELKEEDSLDPIPDDLLDVLENFGVFWRDTIIHRKINVKFNIEKYSCSKISQEINSFLKGDSRCNISNTKGILYHPDREKILADILCLEKMNSTSQNFQSRIFEIGDQLLGFERVRKNADNLQSFNFNPALRFFIIHINEVLEELETVDELSQKINIPVTETIVWLNEYLMIVQNQSEFKSLLEHDSLRIIPNRYNDFIPFEEAEAFGTVDQPLDIELIDILYELNDDEDWKAILVQDGIDIDLPNTRKFEELGNCIEEQITYIHRASLEDNEELLKYKTPIMNLIDWCNRRENTKLAESYLTNFSDKSRNLFFQLTVSNSDLGINAIKMLQDEKSMKLLSKIQNSDIPQAEIENLLDSIIEAGSFHQIQAKADELLEDQRNFEFLRKVGEKVEVAIKNALQGFNVEKVSKGSYDLCIGNGSKQYYLEIKSYANGSDNPFLFAPSQAERAVKDEPNYAICTIERPESNTEEISEQYVIEHLNFGKQLQHIFDSGVKDLRLFDDIRNRKGASRVQFQILGNVRVEILKNKLIEVSSDFDQLIADIEQTLSDNEEFATSN